MNLTAALSNGFFGMFNSSQRHHQASQEILQSTVNAINSNYTPVQDRVTISSAAENISDSPNLEKGIMDLSSAGITYNASAKIVTAANSMLDSLFKAIA